MPRRFRKEYYFSDESYRIPLTRLHAQTRRNLSIISGFYGIDWDEEATVTPQPGTGYEAWSQERIDMLISAIPSPEDKLKEWEASGLVVVTESDRDSYLNLTKIDNAREERFIKGHKKPGKPVKTFIVEGVGPDGEEIVYVRRETGRSMGPTNLYMDGQRFQVTRMVALARQGSHPELLNTGPDPYDPESYGMGIRTLDWR